MKEYDELSSYLRTFWTIRASVLGVGLTLIGLVFKLSMDLSFPFKQMLYVGLLFLVLSIIKMIGSLTRSLYIFTFRLEEISSKFQVSSFWEIWSKHVKTRPEDSGSFPYILIMNYLYKVIFIFVCVSCVQQIIVSHHDVILLFANISVLIISTLLTAMSYNCVRREIDPSQFSDSIYSAWSKSREDAYSEYKHE